MSAAIWVYGQTEGVRVFGEDALVKVRLQQQVDLVGAALPEMLLEAVVRSEAPLQLQMEQKIEFYRDDTLQATAYAAGCSRLGNGLYHIRGQARLEFLQTEFLGGMYEEESATGLMDRLLEGHSYDGYDINISSVTGYIPRGNRQQALRQLCFGIGAMINIDRKGQLWFRLPQPEDMLVLEPGKILGSYSVQLLPEYTRFELASHNYAKGQLPVKLMEQVEYANAGIDTVYFTRPYFNYHTDTELAAYVMEEGPNYAMVQHPGTITLYAYPYIKQTAYHNLQGVQSQDGAYSLVQTVRDVTTVHAGNVDRLLERMMELGKLRTVATVTYAITPGQLLPKAGDPVQLPSPWGTTLVGFVSKSDMLLQNDQQKLELTILCKESK